MGWRNWPPPRWINLLFYFDLGASFFKLLFRRVGISLVGSFEHRLRRAFDQSFGLGQAETRFDLTDGLNGGDFLIRRDRDENHVERGLGFGSRSSSCAATTGR